MLEAWGWSFARMTPSSIWLVALKVLQPQAGIDPALAQDASVALLAEARAAARLNHAHVIAIYDVGHVGTVPFLAMEFIEGTTLRARVAAAGWSKSSRGSFRSLTRSEPLIELSSFIET